MFQVCDCMPCLAVEKVPFWLCQEHGTICCAAPRHSSLLLRHKSAQSRPSGDPALVRRRSISWAVQKISKNMGLLYIPPVPQKALIQKRHQSHELWDTHTYTPTDKHTHTHINVNSAWEHIFAWHLCEVCDVFGQCSALKQLISIDAYIERQNAWKIWPSARSHFCTRHSFGSHGVRFIFATVGISVQEASILASVWHASWCRSWHGQINFMECTQSVCPTNSWTKRSLAGSKTATLPLKNAWRSKHTCNVAWVFSKLTFNLTRLRNCS